jgi:transcriptional regulator with XRE-family HTH domain
MKNEEKIMRASLARRIKEIREAKGLSQFDVSSACDLAQATISQYESSNLKLELYSLMRLAGGLGCSLDHLLGLDVDYSDNLKGRLLKAFSETSTTCQGMLVKMVEFMVAETE